MLGIKAAFAKLELDNIRDRWYVRAKRESSAVIFRAALRVLATAKSGNDGRPMNMKPKLFPRCLIGIS
jgi:hypothetical protein